MERRRRRRRKRPGELAEVAKKDEKKNTVWRIPWKVFLSLLFSVCKQELR